MATSAVGVIIPASSVIKLLPMNERHDHTWWLDVHLKSLRGLTLPKSEGKNGDIRKTGKN